MRTRAFSIVEALVIMGVIGLLIGLLAPALHSAVEGSRATRCQMNLRQMAIAAQNYAAIYEVYPPAIRYRTINGVVHTIAWDWVTAANEVVSPGALWSFTDNPDDVQQCPCYQGPPTFSDPHTGYNYNTTYIGGESSPFQNGWDGFRWGVPPHACRRSAQCAMFGDGGRKAGANKFMRAPLKSEGTLVSLQAIYSGGQAFRHRDATNIAFIDGHIGAANKPCEGKLATPANLQIMGYPGNGFLSDDDRAYDPR